MSEPSAADDESLRRFADFYGFDPNLLNGDDRYSIEGATRTFTGAVTRIRVTQNGRFGNIFLQLLHAVWLARLIGCATIEAFAFEAGPELETVEIAGLRFVFPPEGRRLPASEPTLVGHFFNSYPFESALRALPVAAASEILEGTMRPLFPHVWQVPGIAGPRTAVLHFRAGDVFDNPLVSRWHTQPPAEFYPTIVAHLVANGDVDDVRIVYEGRGNPALERTEAWLGARGITFASQSSDLKSDLACLATATHLVSSVSTLVEVAALLSTNLRTYAFFRQAESHQYIHQRLDPLIAGVLRGRGVRLIAVEDIEGRYTPPGDWNSDAEQVRKLADYPASALSVVDRSADADLLRDAELLARRLANTEAEASRLRETLIVVRSRLERSRGRSISGRLRKLRTALRSAWLGS